MKRGTGILPVQSHGQDGRATTRGQDAHTTAGETAALHHKGGVR